MMIQARKLNFEGEYGPHGNNDDLTGNSFISTGLGTLDEDGQLIEEDTRLAVRALVRAIEIVCKHAELDE